MSQMRGGAATSFFAVVVAVAALMLSWLYATGFLFFPWASLSYYWSWAVPALLMTCLSATRLVGDARWWWMMGIVLTVVSVVVSIEVITSRAADPVRHLLGRDVVGYATLGLFVPLSCTVLADAARRWIDSRWVGVALTAIAYVVLLEFAPFVLLSIHCTSGDCL